jgi:hypothetical protein
MMSRIRDYREWNGRRRRRRSCRYSDSISSPPLPHPPVDESSPSHRLDADSRLSTETSWARRAGALWPHSRPRTMTANYPSTLEQRGRTVQFPARRRESESEGDAGGKTPCRRRAPIAPSRGIRRSTPCRRQAPVAPLDWAAQTGDTQNWAVISNGPEPTKKGLRR